MRFGLSKNDWPELPEKLMAFTESPNPSCQASGLKVLAVLVPQFSAILFGDMPRVGRIAAACAKAEDSDVRYETLCLVMAFVQSKNRAVWKVVQPVLPDLIAGLQTVLEQGADDIAKDFLVSFVKIAESSASFFKPYFANFVQALFAIAKVPEAKNGVRQMAVEVLLSIAKDKPCMRLRAPEFVSELVGILLEFMLTDDDNDDWDQDKEAKDALAKRKCYVGEKGLDRVASAMKGENVMNIIYGYVSQYLKRNEWQYKVVAITAISRTAKYLAEEGIEARLDKIVNILKVQSSNPHHRVRFIVCQAIGQIALHQRPLFQANYAKEILPVLVNGVGDPIPIVQICAVAAFINFVKGIKKADLMPYVEQFMERFLEQIKPEKFWMLREQFVSGIAVLADVIEEEFMKYYSFVVPVMKGIIVASTTKKERTLRGKTFESISIIGLSVGIEKFRDDAHEVIQAVLHISGAGVETDNPERLYIQQGLSRMCLALEEEFVRYLPHLVPSVLKVLNVEPQPVDEENDVEDMAIVSIADGKSAGLKNSVIEEIKQARIFLTNFIRILGPKFGEFLAPTAQSLLPLLSFPLNDLKHSVLTGMAEVVELARYLGYRDPEAQQSLILWVGDVLKNVCENLTLSGDDSKLFDLVLIVVEAQGLSKCLNNAGPDVLNDQQVGAICATVFAFLGEPSQRHAAEIGARNDDPDYVEEDVGQLEEEEEGSEQTVCSILLEIIAAVMQHHADLFLKTSAELCTKFIETHLDPSCIPVDRALALYLCGHVFAGLKDKGVSLWPTFAWKLEESKGDPDPGVRRAAAFCLEQAVWCGLIREAVGFSQ